MAAIVLHWHLIPTNAWLVILYAGSPHPTRIFLKQVRSDLLGLEKAIFFKIRLGGVKLPKTLRTYIFKTVRARELIFSGFTIVLRLSGADFMNILGSHHGNFPNFGLIDIE